jgi:hypothetical protein
VVLVLLVVFPELAICLLATMIDSSIHPLNDRVHGQKLHKSVATGISHDGRFEIPAHPLLPPMLPQLISREPA